MPYLGELCALGTAICWALSGVTFGAATKLVGGFATNQFRVLAALPVLALIAWTAQGQLWPIGADGERATLLFASGLVGLVLGDIGYFHALATIGPRRASVLMATWPIMALALGPLMGDPFRTSVLPGVLVTVSGVVIVLWSGRRGSAWNPDATRAQRWGGIAGALIAALGQAGGVVLARAAMAENAELPAGLDPLGATLLRMFAAAIGLQVVACVRRQPCAARAIVRQPRALHSALLGTLFGPVIGVTLSMIATRRTADVGVAAALMATAPLFMVPIARLAYGARVGFVGWIGTLMSVGGAAWLLARPAAG